MPRRTRRDAWEAPQDSAPVARGDAAGGLPELVLALQRSAGNAAVARLVQNLARQETNDQLTLPPLVAPGQLDPTSPLPPFQLTAPSPFPPFQLNPPSLLPPPPQPGFSLGDSRLRPDTHLQLQLLDTELRPERIRELLRQVAAPAVSPPPGASAGPPPPSPRAPQDRPPGPFDVTPTEPATPGDLLTALASVPEIERLSAQARAKLWTQLPSGGKWALAISGIVIGGSALTGALASPSGRQALAGLGGRPLSIPGIPWFQPEFNVQGTNILVGLHVDVGAFLGGRGGFGTADRGATPLTPQSP